MGVRDSVSHDVLESCVIMEHSIKLQRLIIPESPIDDKLNPLRVSQTH